MCAVYFSLWLRCVEALEAAQGTLDEEYQHIQGLMVEVAGLASVKSKGEMDAGTRESEPEVQHAHVARSGCSRRRKPRSKQQRSRPLAFRFSSQLEKLRCSKVTTSENAAKSLVCVECASMVSIAEESAQEAERGEGVTVKPLREGSGYVLHFAWCQNIILNVRTHE